MKKSNYYADIIDPKFFADCPKTVIAAIAVSYLTLNRFGRESYNITDMLREEWADLYCKGIVPQAPPKKFAFGSENNLK